MARFRFKLRTLLILLAVLPPVAALVILDPRIVLDVGFLAAIGAGSVLEAV